MALVHSPKIVTNGLVFAYDMANIDKSWKGKPTTNYSYLQNPRIDNTYAPYTYTTSGTWQAKHPDAITVYNQAGTNISAYVNTGVTDWTNTYHAIWTYDDVLGKPVVTMRDLDGGNWKAKSFGIVSMSTMGLTHGSTYSISWLQWTTDITKCAWAGIYQRRSSDGAYNFWDGLSGDQGTSYNTVPYRWQRVYATFTVTAGMDLSIGLGLYMYGMYGPAGTLKISDVQLEAGVASGFHNGETRSNTQALLDLTNKNTLAAQNLAYAADGSFSFNGTSGYLAQNTPIDLPTTQDSTVLVWCKPDSTGPTDQYTGLVSWGSRSVTSPSNSRLLSLYTNGTTMYVSSAFWGNDYTPNNLAVTANQWNMVGMISRNITTTNNVTLYCGNANGLNSVTGSSSSYANGLNTTQANFAIGMTDYPGRYFKGSIDRVLVYNRELSAEEIRQVFNAQRGRYGI